MNKLSFVHQATTTIPPPYAGTICNIIISEGSYTSQELAIEIASKMNLAAYLDPNGNIGPPPQQYLCKYNDILNTFWFGNTAHKFILLFSKQEIYTGLCNQPLVWKHYTRWGLPAYLGYKRNDYICEPTTNNTNGYVVGGTTGASYGFSYEWENSSSTPPFNVWLGNGITGASPPATNTAQFVDATKPLVFAGVTGGTRDESGVCQIDIFGEQAIYMELDKFNSIDEMEPYSENTMGIYNNDLNGKVKAAFAKIPILQTQFTQQTDNVNNNLMNISHYDPVIERIDRLRFKFRYHDGRLVDFRCVPFNFSIEFNCLRDRQDKKMAIFVPPLYNT